MSTTKRRRADSGDDSNSRGGCDSPNAESAASPGDGEYAKRKRMINFEPIRLPTVDSTLLQEQAVTRFAYRKVCERLKAKQKVENELRERIRQLEKRQQSDDKMMVIVNRFWSQFNEDARVLLQRFDAELTDDEAITDAKSFMLSLQAGDDEEFETRMTQRVEFSLRAINKLIAAFDVVNERNVKVQSLLNELKTKEEASKEESQNSSEEAEERKAPNEIAELINKELLERTQQLTYELSRVQKLNDKLHRENRDLKLEKRDFEEQRELNEQRTEEAINNREDTYFQLEKAIQEIVKLEERMCEVVRERDEALAKVAKMRAAGSSGAEQSLLTEATDEDTIANVTKKRLEELEHELADQRDLAENRLSEINDYVERVTKLKCELTTLKAQQRKEQSETGDQSGCELRHLQVTFSRLVDEHKQLRSRYDEALGRMEKMRELHAMQMRRITEDEDLAQRELRNEMLEQENNLETVRRDYEMLRLEFDQNLANNEQSGPLYKEVKTLINLSTQQLQQQKAEGDRYKRKWREAVSKIASLNKELEVLRRERDGSATVSSTEGDTSSKADTSKESADTKAKLKELEETNERLRKEIESIKEEEEALLAEMDSTGKAFDESTAANTRLVQQLKEKDEANFKLMTERIRFNQQQSKLQQEYEMLKQMMNAMQVELEATNQAVKHGTEQIRSLQALRDALHKEMHAVRLQCEDYRNHARELLQKNGDLQLQLDRTKSQYDDAQKCISDKTHAQETASASMRRIQEELDLTKKKLERAKKFERADRVDEVYQEEIRELKGVLTCGSCKRNRKNALLVKCNHTFCFDCLKQRYDARQRRCPKCNQQFGASDYKRIYL